MMDRMSVSLETRRSWFLQGVAAWQHAQVVLGVPSTQTRADQYACPLCFEINDDKRQAHFQVFAGADLANGSLTVEHVPPKSPGGRALVLTCRACHNTAGAALDAHARKRENPRDAFLGRVTTKISMTVSGHRLAGSFSLEDGAYHFAATKKPNAHRPDAEAGVRRTLAGGEDTDRIGVTAQVGSTILSLLASLHPLRPLAGAEPRSVAAWDPVRQCYDQLPAQRASRGGGPGPSKQPRDAQGENRGGDSASDRPGACAIASVARVLPCARRRSASPRTARFLRPPAAAIPPLAR